MLETNTIHCLDAREGLKQLEDESIDCIVTSPPFWALRDYGVEPTIWDEEEDCDHEFLDYQDKLAHENRQNLDAGTIGNTKFRKHLHGFGNAKTGFCSKCAAWRGALGLEPNFNLYTKHLCDIFDEIKRVLKKTGSVWVHFGDTYGSSRGEPGRNLGLSGAKELLWNRPAITGMEKSLCQIPSRFAIEMTDRGWCLRNEIIWHKPNCMPSSARDRFTIDFDKVFLFVKSKRYFFESESVKEKVSTKTVLPRRPSSGEKTRANKRQDGVSGCGWADANIPYRPKYRIRRCVWKIPTRPFRGSHFAVFPEELLETPIKAGCPALVCKKCGTPKLMRRSGGYARAFNIRVRDVKAGRIKHSDRRASRREIEQYQGNAYVSEPRMERILGCRCDAGFVPGIVLDPFMGSGTTAVVAERLCRRFLGFEVKHEYAKLARQRLRKVAAVSRFSHSGQPSTKPDQTRL